MSRIDLVVPFAEKDEAKALGARWDIVARVWYVPDGKDSAPFDRWIPKIIKPNVKAQHYYISQSSTPCWKCKRITRVYGFILSGSCEVREDEGDGEGEDGGNIVWDEWTGALVLSYVTGLPDPVIQRAKKISPFWYMDRSKIVPEPYLMNHCEHCKTRLGDFDIIGESDSPLNPIYPESISRMTVIKVDEPFSASASYSTNTEMDSQQWREKF